jgi:hypothetical protein
MLFHYHGDYIPRAIKSVDKRDIPEIPAYRYDSTRATKIPQFNAVLTQQELKRRQ